MEYFITILIYLIFSFAYIILINNVLIAISSAALFYLIYILRRDKIKKNASALFSMTCACFLFHLEIFLAENFLLIHGIIF